MEAILIEVNDTKAFMIEPLEIGGSNLISVLQVYKKRSDMETWRASKRRVSVPAESAKQIGEALLALASNPDTAFRHIAVDPATQFQNQGEQSE